MRVLQLISSGGFYGAESVVVTLAKYLRASGCPNVIAVFHNRHKPNLEIGEHARQLGLAVEMIQCNGRADWGVAGAIRQCIRAHDIDVVHTHGYKANFYGWLAAQPLGTPLVATCHNWTNDTAALRIYCLLDHAILSRFHRVVAVSENVEWFLRCFGLPRGKITRIPNGVDVAAFQRGQPTLRQGVRGGILVATVGRLAPEKGLQYFLQAAQKVSADFPEATFLLIGEGPLRMELEGLARSFGLHDRVCFLGHQENMPDVYASIDILVQPSLKEAMPMTVLEALAAGKPVIATAVGAIPQLVLNNRTGLLVRPCDVTGLANSMARLLSDTGLRQQVGRDGQAWVSHHFSAEAMARKYLNVYEQIFQACAAA